MRYYTPHLPNYHVEVPTKYKIDGKYPTANPFSENAYIILKNITHTVCAQQTSNVRTPYNIVLWTRNNVENINIRTEEKPIIIEYIELLFGTPTLQIYKVSC